MKTQPHHLLGLAVLLAACGEPTDGVADNSFRPANRMPERAAQPEPEPEQRPEAAGAGLTVVVNTDEPTDGRLSVALFAGENAWGWTLDVQERDNPTFPERVRFEGLEPQVVTVRAVLDRAPFDWINPGAEDLIVTGMLMLDPQDNEIELALTDAPEQVEAPATEELLPVRVGCNCDGLSHAEIVILSADGEVLQTETLDNPDLPVDLELDALAAGRYQVAWRTDDFPDWTGQRAFTIPLRNSPLMVLFAPPRAENGNNGSPDAPVTPPERQETPDAEPEPEQEPENRPEPENEPDPEPQEPGVLELRESQDFPNRAEQAQRVQPSSRIFGRLGGARDFDWFVFELTEASPLTIWTTGETDTRCEITRDSDRATAQDDDSGENSNCLMAFESLDPGTYRLRISHFSWFGRGDYTLLISPNLP